MNKFYFFVFALLMGTSLNAQVVADIENISLEAESFLNGADGSGGYTSGNVAFQTTYDTTFSSWGGWAMSNVTDVQTVGFTNQYSAITGGGYDGSNNFAISNTFSPSKIILQNESAGAPITGMYVTNTTYAYLSMLNGDDFAKRFGGEDGTDPDYFLLTINKYENGELGDTPVEFYLADYRFEDSNDDYLVDEWTWVDLSSLGNVDSLEFSLSSTDNGDFGMNTPAYFAVDNLTTFGEPVGLKELLATPVTYQVYPNPVVD